VRRSIRGDRGLIDAYTDFAAIRHCITRVDGEIKYGKLHLIRIYLRKRQSIGRMEHQFDLRTECPLEKLTHTGDQAGQIGGTCFQILLSREG
jgi:hypothetical protein